MNRVEPSHVLIGARRSRAAHAGAFRTGWARLGLNVVEIALDGALVWVAFWVAYLIRYELQFGGSVESQDFEKFATFHSRALLFSILAISIFLVRGMYRLPRTIGLLDESTLVAGALTTAMAGVILTAFLLRFVPSRLVFVYAWAAAIVLLVMRRWFTRRGRAWLWTRSLFVDRVLIVGAGESGRRLMQAMVGTPSLGYRLVGYVDDAVATTTMPVATERRLTRAPRLGTVSDLDAVVTQHDIDEVIISLPADQYDRAQALIDQCRQRDVRFKVVPDLLQLSLDRVDLGEVAGLPLIGLKDASIRGVNYAIKRTSDVVIASVVLGLAALPMGVIALLIRRSSPGPILFRQTRVGRDGVPFTITKFRCMVEDAEAKRAALLQQHDHIDPRLFKLADDPRLTGIGRILRRWSLDELPQFAQVLKGEMSVVGPRPQLPAEIARYEEWHKQRLLVSPGLTGLWQISGRSRLTFDDMVRLDLYYAEHWSTWLDAKIILRTVPAVLAGRGAH